MWTPTGSSTAPAPGRWRFALPLAALAILAVLAHLRALGVPFIYDDIRTIANNASIIPGGSVRWLLEYERFRPLANLSLKLDYSMWGLSPAGFHATALALHALAVVLVQRCMSRLSPPRAQVAGEPPSEATFAAVVLAIHPALVQAVGYCSGRAELLCAVFFLSAFLAHLRLVETGRARWGVLVLALWALAIGSKEVGASLPFVLALSDAVRDAPGRRRRLLRMHLPMMLLVVVAGAWRLSTYMSGEGGAGWLSSEHFAAIPLAAWRYLALLVLPVGQSIVHLGPSPTSLFAPGVLLAAGALVAGAVVAWTNRARAPLVAFGLGWFLLVLAPSLVVPLRERVAEQRLYLASAGGLVALAALLRPLVIARLGPRWPLAAGALALTLLGLTAARYAIWRDPEAVWTEALEREPRCALAWNNRGTVRYERGRHLEARADFDRALELEPGYADPMANRAAVRLDLGDVAGAAADVEQVLARHPRHLTALITRAVVRDRQGDFAGALADCDAALAINSMLARPIVNRAVTLAHMDRRQEALLEYDRALAIDPRFVAAWVNRALTRSRLGDIEGALSDCRSAIALDPGFVMAYCALGQVHARRGDVEATRAAFDQALARRPGDPATLHLLGVALTIARDEVGAIDAYRRAAAARPEVTTLLNLAALLVGRGEQDAALAIYVGLVRARPRLVPALVGRARILAARGDASGARSDLDLALSVDPDEPFALKLRGELRARQGDPAGAEGDLRRALVTCRQRAPELEPALRELLAPR